jgi:hypothetical protein
MLTDSDRGAADRAARNEYLMDIDEAWEACRDAVEGARSSYEESLDLGRMVFEERQDAASNEHSSGLDEAWAIYKQEVSSAPSETRRKVITEARAAYNAAVATLQRTYDDALSAAHAEYAQATESVRSAYEATVDAALGAHREAIQSVKKFMETPEDGDVDYLGLASELAARASNGHADGVELGDTELGDVELGDDDFDHNDVESLAASALSSLN